MACYTLQTTLVVFLGLPQKKQNSVRKYQTCKKSLANPVNMKLLQPQAQLPLPIVIISLTHTRAHTHRQTLTPSITARTGRVGAGCQMCSTADCPCSPLGFYSKAQETATQL